MKSTFRKDLYKEAIGKLKKENRRLKETLEEKDRIIKQKEVFIMIALEEFSKSKEKIQHHFEQKINQLNNMIADQKKYLGILCLLNFRSVECHGFSLKQHDKGFEGKIRAEESV
jgi:predicted RNase H-like nuclease (RuvC/YqgF family)